MAIEDVGGACLDAIYALLRDPSYGFNGLVKRTTEERKLSPVWDSVDFDNPGVNFFFMQLTDTTLDALPVAKNLTACLYLTGFTNTVMQKPMKFSGPVVVAFDLWPTWGKSRLPGTEKALAVFDAVLVELLNRKEAQAILIDPVVYKANVKMRRGIPTLKGAQWRQQVRYEIPLDVNRGF